MGFTNLPLLSLMDKEGIVPQEETDRKNNSSADKSKYLRVALGDIAYNTMRMWEGRSAYVGIEGLISPAYTVCVPSKDVNGLFFSYYFKTKPLIAQFRRYSQGLVKDTLNLKYEAFSKIEIAYPKEKREQQKITDCLSSLDELITAETQELDALKTHKKGLMQQLFPCEGEAVPRLRFPEFRDAGEWKPTTVGQIADFKSGGTPSKENSAFWNGSIPWASAKDMKHLFLDDTEDHITTAAVKDGAKQVPAGAVLILTRGMTLLKDLLISVSTRQMSFNQDVKALQPKGSFDGRFMAYLLLGCKQRLLRLVDIAGHGTGRLDTDKLKAFDVMVPQPAEQQHIADCLLSFEALIITQSQKIDALKTHKMGLMQQVFPILDEVQA